MKKRIIAAAVAGILAVSMVAGCARSNKSSEEARALRNEPQTVSYTAGASSDTLGLSKEYNYDMADYEAEEFFGESGAVNAAP